MERWKAFVENPRYEVSSIGSVRYISTGRRRKLHSGQNDYPVVSFRQGGRNVLRPVHRLVALSCAWERCSKAFLGPPPTDAHQVAHGNGVRTDNRVENLRWATPKENGEDKVEHGNAVNGERNGNARLSDRHAAALLVDRGRGMTQRALAKEYGISQAQVWNIVNGHQRRHLREGASAPGEGCVVA